MVTVIIMGKKEKKNSLPPPKHTHTHTHTHTLTTAFSATGVNGADWPGVLPQVLVLCVHHPAARGHQELGGHEYEL